MDTIRRITDRWNEGLSLSGKSDAEHLLNGQKHRKLYKYGRPLCGVARPHFVGEREFQRHRHVVDVIAKSLVKARDHVTANREREAEHLGRFYDWIGDLMHLEPKIADHGAITRLDAFRTAGGLSFIEMNADCPGGAGHNDGLVEVFQELETFQALKGDFDLQPLLLQPAVAKALMEAWRDWGGKHPPTMAIVGWFDRIGTTAEAVLQETDAMRGAGIGKIFAVAPGELEFDGHRLVVDGTAIDLVYRLALTRDVLEALDEITPLLTALRQNAVCMVNPFHAELMGHKALFALLTDPDIDLGLSSAERKVIRDHVPWGRLLRETSTSDPEGRRVDLLDYLVANRETLVLKPTHEAKGDGVELGWHHEESSWQDAIAAALAADFIVQQRIPTEQVSYPVAEPDLPERTMYEDTDPFVTRGQLAGFLTRISESEIINVSRQGSVVPTFVVRQ